MDSLYNETANRLWEKFEYHRNKFEHCHVDFKESFPVDQLSRQSPYVLTLIKEVCDEYGCEMSEHQCSWVVSQAFAPRDDSGTGQERLDLFNRVNNTNLAARA